MFKKRKVVLFPKIKRKKRKKSVIYTCQKGEHKAAKWPDGTAQGAVVSVLKPLKWVKLWRSRETGENIIIAELDRTAKIN